MAQWCWTGLQRVKLKLISYGFKERIEVHDHSQFLAGCTKSRHPARLAPLSLFEKQALKLAHLIIGATEITIASFGRVLGTQSCQVLLDLVGKCRNSVFGEDSYC